MTEYSCGWISVATYYGATSTTVQWPLPLSLACVGPLAVLVGFSSSQKAQGIKLGPAKPTRLGKPSNRLHKDPANPTDAAARAEFVQITWQVAFDKEAKAGFVQMFTNSSWRRRSILVMFLLFAS